MDESKIRKALFEILVRVSGIEELTDDTCPFSALGLKSIDGEQVAVELEIHLNIDLDDKKNPFVDDEGRHRRPRRVGDIVTWIADNHD